MMKKIIGAIALALAITGPALARTSNSAVMVPSAQNSGAGIFGFAGTEAGPAVRSGTVGSAAMSTYNLAVSEQDAANIPALPGTEGGPSVKATAKLS